MATTVFLPCVSFPVAKSKPLLCFTHSGAERQEAIAAFRNIVPHYHGRALPHNITQQSYFVLSPRGISNLDCYRSYEAAVRGAIPVVVGPEDELRATFGHYRAPPPWVFAPSWTAAREQVLQLLCNRTALLGRQRAVLAWYRAEWTGLRKTIKDVLGLEQGQGLGQALPPPLLRWRRPGRTVGNESRGEQARLEPNAGTAA